MSLAAGTRLGPYEILGPLGAGGMGEVYRARDTRLERTVAVKVLPTQTIPSDEVRKRFEREAKAISQLSHPHICTLFDVGRAEDRDFLVMELLEGETLQARLSQGALPLELVLRSGVEIASALDRAHRRGIVHRDLKPGNLMLTKAGIKLLDFGLARTIVPALDSAALSEVRTTTAPTAVTAEGAVLGTLQYMAPEQLEGKPADARTDIFALGGVLFEMTTGQRAFGGTSAAAIASEILRAEAPTLTSLRRDSPPALERVVSVCLAKDPDERWQSVHDVKLQLAALSGAAPAPSAEAASPSSRRFLPWVAAAIASGVAAATLLRPPTPPAETARQIRFALPPPEGGRFTGWAEATPYALSPDGSTLAFIAADSKGQRVFLQPLSSLHAKALEGTEGAQAPFWSPDGKSLGFFAEQNLKRLDLGSGAAVPICNVRPGAGITGTWGADGQILFASIVGNGIFRVRAAGGEPVAEREAKPEAGILRVLWPSFLPDGKRYLYLVRRPDRTYHIMLAEVGGVAREVCPSDSFAQYVAPGHLVFARAGTLLAQRFDAATGRVEGEPVAIAEPVLSFATTGWASFAASPQGVLAYASPGNRARLNWFDREGHHEALESTATALWVRFSPDGRRALFNRTDPRTGNLDIWSLDLARGVESRLTTDPDTETSGMLLPDGSLVYSEPRGDSPSPQLLRRNLGTGETRELVPKGGFQEALDVTPDGRTLVFAERLGQGAWDLFQVSLSGGPAQSILATPFTELDLRLSPDGRFAAFYSNEPGRGEVYVAPFPQLGERTRVTQQGARAPRWSRNGRELFYLTADRRLVAVPVRTGASIELGTPHTLFAMQGKYTWADYDVAADGRFLAIVPEALTSEQPLTVVVNWMADLRAQPTH